MPNEMTLSRLREIEERAKAATEGLWEYDGENFIFAGTRSVMVAETRGLGANLPIDDNGQFIAHSRQDIPSLTKALLRAWKALRYIATKDKIRGGCGSIYVEDLQAIARTALPDDWEE